MDDYMDCYKSVAMVLKLFLMSGYNQFTEQSLFWVVLHS